MSNKSKRLYAIANTSDKTFKKGDFGKLQLAAPERIKTICIGTRKETNLSTIEEGPREIVAFDQSVPKNVVRGYINSLTRVHPQPVLISVGQNIPGTTHCENWESLRSLLN